MPFLSKILAKIVKISLKSTLNANIYYYFLLCVKRKRHVPSSIGWDALGINVRLAFSVLDKLVEAIPGVVALVLGQVVVEGLVYGFDALSTGWPTMSDTHLAASLMVSKYSGSS